MSVQIKSDKEILFINNNFYSENSSSQSSLFLSYENSNKFVTYAPFQCKIECNGLVPREDYTRSTEDVLAKEAGLQSLYKNCTIKKGEIHEVRRPI